MKNIWILAQADATEGIITGPAGGTDTDAQTAQQNQTQAPGTPAPAEGEQTKPPQWPTFVMMGVIFLVMYMIMFRGPKKKQQKHSQMVQSLSKNDRIRTIGGIFGTVIDVKEGELTVKIDESTNTKMKIATGAVAEVLTNKQD